MSFCRLVNKRKGQLNTTHTEGAPQKPPPPSRKHSSPLFAAPIKTLACQENTLEWQYLRLCEPFIIANAPVNMQITLLRAYIIRSSTEVPFTRLSYPHFFPNSIKHKTPGYLRGLQRTVHFLSCFSYQKPLHARDGRKISPGKSHQLWDDYLAHESCSP